MTPINVDQAVGPRAYDRYEGQLLVTTMFRTLQGEMPYSGLCSVFLRLAGCNYGAKTKFCQFCDTAFQFQKGRPVGTSELLAELTSLEGFSPSDILVLTGGEPTLQLNLLDFLLELPGDIFPIIQFETNGTQPRFFEDERYTQLRAKRPVTVVVSPKANVETGNYPDLHPTVLGEAAALKFVVDPEMPGHWGVPEWALEAHDEHGIPLYVSPMAHYLRAPDSEVANAWDHTLIDREKTEHSYAYAAEMALRQGLRLSLQTHLFATLP